MKTIMTYFRAFFSLGWLGVVMILMALAVFGGALSQSSAAFDAVLERMDLLNQLEAGAALDLADVQIAQVQEVFTQEYGLSSRGALNGALQADERLLDRLERLEAEGRFEADEDAYATDLSADLDEFYETYDSLWMLFESLSDSAFEMDADVFYETLDEYETLTGTFEPLRLMILAVEQDRQWALADFSDEVNANVWLLAVALTATLLLALLGYQVIAQTVHPLRQLRNTIAAIRGDLHRPAERLPSGAVGGFARALEELAQAETERNQTAKDEVERLRQALYESRRRRLKIYHPGQEKE
jgi:hypothetical protein